MKKRITTPRPRPLDPESVDGILAAIEREERQHDKPSTQTGSHRSAERSKKAKR